MTVAIDNSKQAAKAKEFYDLHHTGKLLVLANVWDPLGALLLESLGFPAIATASAAIAFANGYDDGENIPFTEVTRIIRGIASRVDLPVTADIERGYAENEEQLRENIRRLLQTGVVGINFEDTDKKTSSLLPVEIQCEKIKLIKEVSAEMGVPLFINARSDVYVRGGLSTQESKLKEAIRRGNAYKSAGADSFFPIVVQNEKEIKAIVDEIQMPVNILLIPGVPELNTLQELGVARVSVGPGLLKIAIQSMKKLATKLQRLEGLSDLTSNEVTSDYLKKLVNKTY
jgi:2-methylisocitrate lyase-like PEP mutase family enzyme